MEYFKKPSGKVFKVLPQHDLKSLKERFEECDVKGNPVVKATKKTPKKKEAK